MKNKRIDMTLVEMSNYTTTANIFADGKADAMFSGSGVAGTMIIKDMSYPVAPPVGTDSMSMYWVVILAPNGSPKYIINVKITQLH